MDKLRQSETNPVNDDAEIAVFLARLGLYGAWEKSPDRWREAYQFGRMHAERLDSRPSTIDELMWGK
ncbi:hypothetical protein [Paraburkholderia aspalathi]|uniref:Uncharacterized protein n=1 Tax=Paraburkholderia aspalathi TaxID=1324617 RepID=A0A1I7BBD9_9BURK|nr:hypothetical protein [Paraburkholderia aspalathi]SFT84454.1 hypothetical protein SAMN05192563_1004334 [Paraburkholderia aspalathi]